MRAALRGLAVAVALAGCEPTGEEARGDPASAGAPGSPGQASEQAEGASTEPSARDEARPDPDTPAGELARRVYEAAGGEALPRVAELRFRFVVESGGERVADVMHRWDRRARRDHVTWTARDGSRHDALVDLASREACGTVDGEPVSGRAAAKLGDDAYGRWVNDSYWLVMPLKLFDPGVRLEREEPREHEGTQHDILKLQFEEVGLTPGDTYWLFVDPEEHRVRRWEMLLEASDPPPKGVSWTDYREVGPLVLAHDHRSDDGEHRVLFEDTEALEQVAPEHFEVKGCD